MPHLFKFNSFFVVKLYEKEGAKVVVCSPLNLPHRSDALYLIVFFAEFLQVCFI